MDYAYQAGNQSPLRGGMQYRSSFDVCNFRGIVKRKNSEIQAEAKLVEVR